jgi:hypothetical protein
MKEFICALERRSPTRLVSIFTFILLSFTSLPTQAADTSLPFVSPMFGDNVVLQRGKPNPIWGWSKPGDAVQVELAGHTAKALADATGRWQVRLDPPAPGGPYTVKIEGPQEHVVLHEVLVGDVWLCGGQSNMELGLARTRNGSNEIATAVRYAWQSNPQATLFNGAGLPATPFRTDDWPGATAPHK